MLFCWFANKIKLFGGFSVGSSWRLKPFKNTVFAGGGNRCWWQAGLITRFAEQGIRLPPNLMGTSAGAAIAAAYIVHRIPEALDACIKLYRQNESNMRWEKLRQLKREFAHRQIYPAWIESIIRDADLETIKKSTARLTVAVTHPARLVGTTLSICLATAAYLVDKKLWHSIHPQLPKYLGLRQGFYPLHEHTSLQACRALLCAAAAAPPLMPPVKIQGLDAFDGGYFDNAPIAARTAASDKETFILLTRHYPERNTLFIHEGRTYLQPSRPVPVSTWDCTAKATVVDAFTLGYEDADRLQRG